jgi:hypothetical protein
MPEPCDIDFELLDHVIGCGRHGAAIVARAQRRELVAQHADIVLLGHFSTSAAMAAFKFAHNVAMMGSLLAFTSQCGI